MAQIQFDWYKEQKRAYIDDARWVARKLLKRRPYITTDDIWKASPPPKFINPKVMGTIFQDKDFESIGFTRTKRASSHGRIIQRYRLKELAT